MGDGDLEHHEANDDLNKMPEAADKVQKEKVKESESAWNEFGENLEGFVGHVIDEGQNDVADVVRLGATSHAKHLRTLLNGPHRVNGRSYRLTAYRHGHAVNGVIVGICW